MVNVDIGMTPERLADEEQSKDEEGEGGGR